VIFEWKKSANVVHIELVARLLDLVLLE